MKTIGLDIGTTTVSAVVMDSETKTVLSSKTVPNDAFLKTENEWEHIQNVDRILEIAVELLDKLLNDNPEVGAIGLTGQMHGIIYLDDSGRHISPLFTWQDGRGDRVTEAGKTPVQEIRDRFGLNAASGYGFVTHLYHVRKSLVPEGAKKICTVADYIGMQLTERITPLVHCSNAASFGLYDAKENRFLSDVLRDLDIDCTIAPEVTDYFETLGSYRGIPVTVALGDNQASFLGSVGTETGAVLLNMGTGGQISVLSDHFREIPGIDTRPFLKDKYLLVGASLSGGQAFAMLERFLRSYVISSGGENRSQYDIMLRLAEAGEQSSDPILAETTFCGTRQDSSGRGSFQNISESNFTPENLICSVLFGMAQELFDMYSQIAPHAGTAQRLIVSGNGMRKNPVLRRICGKLFSMEPIPAPFPEEAAAGAAISAAM